MIPTGKSIDIRKRYFSIPSSWRKEMNLTQGSVVQIRIKNDFIIIRKCDQSTTEITSTVSRGGVIYIPTEVRNHFKLKGITQFELFADEKNSSIIICQDRIKFDTQFKSLKVDCWQQFKEKVGKINRINC